MNNYKDLLNSLFLAFKDKQTRLMVLQLFLLPFRFWVKLGLILPFIYFGAMATESKKGFKPHQNNQKRAAQYQIFSKVIELLPLFLAYKGSKKSSSIINNFISSYTNKAKKL